MSSIHMLGSSEDEVLQLAQALQARRWRLVTVESCTGGLIAAACTSIAGSSVWFERGFVTYSNEAKTESVGVPAALVAGHGAVSEAVVRAMAMGGLLHSHADLALAVTGIAGPDGGVPGKPVGTVWVGWAVRETATAGAQLLQLSGDRAAVRDQSTRWVLRRAMELAAGLPLG